MREHTPAPWKARKASVYCDTKIGKAQGVICGRIYGGSLEEVQANANLIAAAPELLEACKEFVRKVECGEARSRRSYAKMKTAIQKAEEG